MNAMRFLSILMTLPIVSGLQSEEMEIGLTEQTTENILLPDGNTLSSFLGDSTNQNESNNQQFSLLEQASPILDQEIDSTRSSAQIQPSEIAQEALTKQEPSIVQSTTPAVEAEVVEVKVQKEEEKEEQNEYEIVESYVLLGDSEDSVTPSPVEALHSYSIDISFAEPYHRVENTPSFQTTPVSLLGNWFIHEESVTVAFQNETPSIEMQNTIENAEQIAPIAAAPLEEAAPTLPAVEQPNPIAMTSVEEPAPILAAVELPDPIAMSSLEQPSPVIATSSTFTPIQIENTPLPKRSQNSKPGNTTARQPRPAKPPRPDKPRRDLFLAQVGAVYLRPYQGGTDFASLVDTIYFDTDGTEPAGKNKTLDFDFDWGFRAGIGYQAVKTRQTVTATYLYFATDASKTTISGFAGDLKTAPQAVFSTFLENPHNLGGLGLGDYFHSAKTEWNLHFNMLDLALGKKFSRKSCMTFEPFVGLKGILLSETQKSTYTPATQVIREIAGPKIQAGPIATQTPGMLKQKTDFHGAGVMGGLTLDWTLTKWLSFIGSIDAALLYTSIKTKRTSDNQLPSLVWIGSSTDIKGVPVLDGMFALRGVYCWKSGRFIDVKIGFEEHYIFQTMKHVLLNADSSTDLSLMGWFGTVGFGF